MAIDNELVSRLWNNIGLLADITRILREKPPTRKTFQDILEFIARIVPYEAGTLYLMNTQKDQLDEVASHRRTVNLINFLNFDMGAGLAGWAARQKRPIVIPGRDPATSAVRHHHDSVLILPLLVVDELIGVLCFSHHAPDAFGERQQRLMEIAADQVGISLERMMHRRRLEQKEKEITKIQAKLEEVQSHPADPEHIRAVRDLSTTVNREVNDLLSAIAGHARIIELEAAGLPEDITRSVDAIIDNTRRISLITHKLSQIDRLVSETHPEDTGPAAAYSDPSAGGSQ